MQPSFFIGKVFQSENIALFSENSEWAAIPLQLSERNQTTLWIAMIGLAVSFILLALSKIGTSKLTYIFSKLILKNSAVTKIINEEYALNNFSSFLLIVNFILTTSILTYLTFLHINLGLETRYLLLLPVFPAYIFLWPLIWFWIIGFITKEQKVFSENTKNGIIISQITGFIFSFILLIWTFNLKWSNYFMFFFIGIIFLSWIYKIFRGIIFSFQHHIAWYYIILYFCTLEILPLLIVFSVYKW